MDSSTEDTIRGRTQHWMEGIINNRKLHFTGVDVQVTRKTLRGTKWADIVIWAEKNVPACNIELKLPFEGWSPYDDDLIEDAANKAVNMREGLPSRFFGTWNINDFVLWRSMDAKAKNIFDRRIKHYSVTEVRKPEQLEESKTEDKIKDFLENFLEFLEDLYFGKAELPKLPIDEFFINKLRSAIRAFFPSISEEVESCYQVDSSFRNRLNKWFVEQAWSAPSSSEDYKKTARQFLYLLVDKVLFYNTLRATPIHRTKLKLIEVPENVKNGDAFKEKLQKYFDKAKKIDYETVFGTDFIETVPIPNVIVERLVTFVNDLSRYDFSKLKYTDIGKIFDKLIPENERHNLGQYFTKPDVVDVINAFCIRDGSQIIADFGCGAGTFLVRGHARLKTIEPEKRHETLLEQLYGVDISKFPAHLSTINLTVRGINKLQSYPRILRMDFFDVKPGFKTTFPVEGLNKSRREVKFPPEFDVVVGNPPYTRQEELEIYTPSYKQTLEKALKMDWGNGSKKKLGKEEDRIKLGKRASIYAHFFLHGAKFLREGGRLGYVTSNSWLDVDYGKYLQKFFLEHFKIVAIIESKIERWFEDADINTAITVLERCNSKKKRNENIVKFVQLKIPLKELIPSTDDENERWRRVDKLVKLVENSNELYENDNIRIFPKTQKELWDEGILDEKYGGSKWGKYLRAPEIFFKILEKEKNLLVPLGEVAEIRFGIKTGANEFFYLTEEQINSRGIEREFWMHKKNGRWIPNYVIKSPRECKSVIVKPEDLKYRVLMIHKDKKDLKGTNVLKYIHEGETRVFGKGKKAGIPSQKPTCASRKPRWYDLGKRKHLEIIFPRTFDIRYISFLDVKKCYFESDRHYGVKSVYPLMLDGYFNSTLFSLFAEATAKLGLGLGALDLNIVEFEKIPVFQLNKVSISIRKNMEKLVCKMSERPIGSIFEEIGAKKPGEVSLDGVKPDKRELDKIVMGKILGLTESEQLEVYKAVVDLVGSRIKKARSVKKEIRKRGPIPEELAKGIVREIETSTLKRFPDEYLGDYNYKIVHIPKGGVEVGSNLHGFFVNIGGERIDCSSPDEAKYLQFAALNGITEVKIPVCRKTMKKLVRKYGRMYKKLEREIKQRLEEAVPDRKLRQSVELRVWAKLKEISNRRTTGTNPP